MKKFAIVLMVLVFAASLVPVASAADNLSLSGTMRVRAWDKENYFSFDDDNNADDLSYFDQRFRLAATIKANDAVSAHLRFDFAEATWGGSDWAGSRYNDNSKLQVDRAYLQVKQDMYTLKAGQLFFSTGQRYIVYDNNTTGATLTLNLPVKIDLHYSKLDENGGNTDDDALGTEDKDAYVAQATYKADAFTVGAFYAALEDSSAADDSPNAFGVFGSTMLAGLKLSGELDIFGGEQSPSIDYMGTQLYLNGEYKFESFLLGADFYYAQAADSDGSEWQLTGLTDFGDFQPATYGAFVEDYHPTPGDAHDPSDDHAGVVGGSLYVKGSPMDKLTLWGQVAYLTPEDDDLTSYDDFTVINLSAQYEFVPNATFAVLYSTTLVGAESGVSDDSAQAFVGRLQIKF